MALLILSFMAGVLTVAAPCILPLLPVIVGGSFISSAKEKPDRVWRRPIVIAGSLAVSIVIFTLLLKTTTALLGIPQIVWQIFSGVIVMLLGINFIKPELWKRISAVNKLNIGTNRLLGKSYTSKFSGRDVLVGFSLGPVFASCSPTYTLIVATVLPATFIKGLVYLAAYAIGVAGTLLLVSFTGQAVITKLKWLSNPYGLVSKVIGVVFIIVGLVVLLGIDKKIQSYVLDRGWYDPISNLEEHLSN